MTMNCDDGIDLTMRAPYIPMNENDDLPLLTEDLMWSAFSDDLSLHKEIKDAIHGHDPHHHHHTNKDTSTMYNAMPSTPASATSMVMTVLHASHPQFQMQMQQQQQSHMLCDTSPKGQFDFRTNKTHTVDNGDICVDGGNQRKISAGCGMDQDDDVMLGSPVDDVMEHIYQKNSKYTVHQMVCALQKKNNNP